MRTSKRVSPEACPLSLEPNGSVLLTLDCILHEETHFLTVNKPAGLFTQAAPGIDSVQVALAELLKERDAHAGAPFVGLPHRLDRASSGIMLIARNQRALKRFGQQFQSRKIGKFYLAVVDGNALDGKLCDPSTPQAVVPCEDYLRKVTDQPIAEVVDAQAEGAKLAQMDAQVVAAGVEQSLLLVHLHTGRMHQIRLQLSHRGFPVLGDSVYGSQQALAGTPKLDEPVADEPRSDMEAARLAPIALHALRLEFRHPQSAVAMSSTAPVPSYWQQLSPEIIAAANDLVACSRQEASAAWSLVSKATPGGSDKNQLD